MIRIHGLKRNWGTFNLTVDELVIPRGAHLALLGPCGAGKTLFLETLAGHFRAREGEIRIDGKPVGGLPPEKRGVGFIYQKVALFPHMSVKKNIAFGLRYHNVTRSERERVVMEMAERIGIGDIIDVADVSRLSGGESQKVALARTLVTRPKALLLDEPLHSLDRPAREEMLRLMLDVTREIGTTVMHVTHDFSEASAAAQLCAILIDGKLKQSGKTADVFMKPVDRETAAFLGVANCWPVERHEAGVVSFLGADWRIECMTPETAFVCLRPEVLLLGEALEKAEYRFKARLVEISDRTDFVRLTLERGSEKIIANGSRASLGEIAASMGSEIEVGFRSADIHYLRED